MPRFVPRRYLPHQVPGWVADGELFFLTVCKVNTLAIPELAAKLIESVQFRHQRGRWFVRLWLVMPDHVHGLVAFVPGPVMETEIESWKRFTARQHGAAWQNGFFDHRLRREESFAERARYIRGNPVRAGLVSRAEEWPWTFAPEQTAYRH